MCKPLPIISGFVSPYVQKLHFCVDPEYVIKEAPLTGEVVEAMRQVPRDSVPDSPTGS
jgi:hypothetical protein